MVTPGAAAVCFGTVMHHRRRPVEHSFTYPVNQIWLDPDRPEALCDKHPLWSARKPAPIRFRRADYFDSGDQPIGPALRDLVASHLGHRPAGEIRMLSQPRTWGWLFNPITLYLLWHAPSNRYAEQAAMAAPAAAVLEVTNTPWKERHRYVCALAPNSDQFPKAHHVSPFLADDCAYRLRLWENANARGVRLTIEIDVFEASAPNLPVGAASSGAVGSGAVGQRPPLLSTRLALERIAATPASMSKALIRNPFPTHSVSFGIHRQALALWRKRVPFVPHPKRQPKEHLGPVSQRNRL